MKKTLAKCNEHAYLPILDLSKSRAALGRVVFGLLIATNGLHSFSAFYLLSRNETIRTLTSKTCLYLIKFNYFFQEENYEAPDQMNLNDDEVTYIILKLEGKEFMTLLLRTFDHFLQFIVLFSSSKRITRSQIELIFLHLRKVSFIRVSLNVYYIQISC